MMNRLDFSLIASLLVILVVFNCADDDKANDCIANATGFVNSVEAPASGMINSDIEIQVNYLVSDGCGGFGKFIESNNGNSYTIEVEAKHVGCACIQIVQQKTATYTFNTSNPGDYQLNFKSIQDEYVTVNLSVN